MDVQKDKIVNCPTCGEPLTVTKTLTSPFHGKSFERVEPCAKCEKARQMAIAAHELQITAPRMIRESGIHVKLQHLGLDNGSVIVDSFNSSAVETLREWVKGDFSVYFYGPTGSGKTTLAIASLLDCCRTGQSVAFVPESALEADMRANWGKDLFHRCRTADVLLLDDIGSRSFDSKLLTAYRDIFDARDMCGVKMKTLITGQYPTKELINIFRDPTGKQREDIVSRIVELVEDEISVSGSNRRFKRGGK